MLTSALGSSKSMFECRRTSTRLLAVNGILTDVCDSFVILIDSDDPPRPNRASAPVPFGRALAWTYTHTGIGLGLDELMGARWRVQSCTAYPTADDRSICAMCMRSRGWMDAGPDSLVSMIWKHRMHRFI